MPLAVQAIDFLCWNKKLIGAEAITGGTAASSGLTSWDLEKGRFVVVFFPMAKKPSHRGTFRHPSGRVLGPAGWHCWYIPAIRSPEAHEEVRSPWP